MFVKAGALEMVVDRISEKVLEWAGDYGLGEAVTLEEELEVARL